MTVPSSPTTPVQSAEVNAFLRHHGSHYQIRSILGKGASGTTYRGFDLRRGVPVCLKFYHQGSAPPGSRRDWFITSVLKEPSINDTFSVEHYEEAGNTSVVVISRFQDGSNLHTVLDRLETETKAELKSAVQDQLLRKIGPPLCKAVAVCHDAGHGHGDLHERNVVVTASGPVVIDFGNASWGPPNAEATAGEQSFMQADIRALRRLLGCLTYGSRWHDQIFRVLDSCETAAEMGEAIEQCLNCVIGLDIEDPARFDAAHFERLTKDHALLSFAGRKYGSRFRELIDDVARQMGATAVLAEVRAKLAARALAEGGILKMRGTLTATRTDVNAELDNVLRTSG